MATAEHCDNVCALLFNEMLEQPPPPEVEHSEYALDVLPPLHRRALIPLLSDGTIASDGYGAAEADATQPTLSDARVQLLRSHHPAPNGRVGSGFRLSATEARALTSCQLDVTDAGESHSALDAALTQVMLELGLDVDRCVTSTDQYVLKAKTLAGELEANETIISIASEVGLSIAGEPQSSTGVEQLIDYSMTKPEQEMNSEQPIGGPSRGDTGFQSQEFLADSVFSPTYDRLLHQIEDQMLALEALALESSTTREQTPLIFSPTADRDNLKRAGALAGSGGPGAEKQWRPFSCPEQLLVASGAIEDAAENASQPQKQEIEMEEQQCIDVMTIACSIADRA